MIELDPAVLGGIVLRTLVVYIVLLGTLRLAGKRELGQMSIFDLVVILVIASAVQNAMVGGNTSLTGGLVAAFTLLAANAIVGRVVTRTTWLENTVRGKATLLINNGKLFYDHLHREGITREELMMALREHGLDDVEDVKLAVLEVDGTISVIPHGTHVYRGRRRIGSSFG